MKTNIMPQKKTFPPRRIDPTGPTHCGTGQGCAAQAVQVKQHQDEAGYMLLAVIFMVALVVLSLALAAPKVAAAIQRDREVEMVHRGEQYKRAIRLYYKKFGSYPSSIDQLEKTNNVRYLRKRYLDPLTGKDDWKLIRQGQAHVCPLGFFGQPLGIGAGVPGATSIGAGSSSSIGGSTGPSSFGGGSSSFGSSSGASGSLSGSSSGTSGTPSTGMMDSSTSAIGTGGTNCGGAAGAGGTAVAGPGGATASGDGTGSGTGLSVGSSQAAGNGLGTSSGSFGGGSSSTSTSTTLGGGNTNSTGFGADISSTLGGAPIMGVMPPQTKATILQYKLKTHYNQWEFTYWPAEEQMAAGSILGGAGNINGSGNSVNGPGSSGTGGIGSTGINSGSSSTFGSSSGSTGFGSSTGSGGNGSQSTTTPQ